MTSDFNIKGDIISISIIQADNTCTGIVKFEELDKQVDLHISILINNVSYYSELFSVYTSVTELLEILIIMFKNKGNYNISEAIVQLINTL